MERSEIEKTVTGIVCEQLGVAESEVNTDSSFVDDLDHRQMMNLCLLLIQQRRVVRKQFQ